MQRRLMGVGMLPVKEAYKAWLDRIDRPPVPPLERRGEWISTLSSEPWWAHDPHPADVREEDFAACALVMRWGGQMRYVEGHPRAGRLAPYSVGQHGCMAYDIVVEMGGSLIERACALYHDLHEIQPPGDLLAPVVRGDAPIIEHLKRMSRMAAICFRRALSLPVDLPPIVKKVDNILLATERRDFTRWPKGDVGRAYPREVEPRERRIEAWDCDHTEAAFMRRHRAIGEEWKRPIGIEEFWDLPHGTPVEVSWPEDKVPTRYVVGAGSTPTMRWLAAEGEPDVPLFNLKSRDDLHLSPFTKVHFARRTSCPAEWTRGVEDDDG